ncbi:uncharacterized protein METZ01_LOCUS148094, partial [marine metagenome]
PFFGVWSDPDLGNYADDLVGVDVDSNLIYVYNGNDQDDVFPIPPAVGYKYISGLNSLDNDLYAAGAIYEGNISTEPDNETEAYNRMQGLLNDGTNITDPNTGQDTTFMMNGDPVSGTGWIDDNVVDKRILMSVSANLSAGETTPVVAPGDTVGFVIAVIIAQGTDRLNSITELREAASEAKTLWDNNFAGVTLVDRPVLTSDEDNGLFSGINFEGADPGETLELSKTYHNTGNQALNISMSANNVTASPSSATIATGGYQSFTFSYTADNFIYSAHNVPSEYGTIQSAVDAAAITQFSEDMNLTTDDPYTTHALITNYGYSGSGDTVYVSPGTYTENLVIDDKSICMISTNGDPASTIIDGNNDGTAIKIGSWRGMFTLNGFTIQNGNTQNFPYPGNIGAGLSLGRSNNDFGTVNITNNIFKDNHSGYGGAFFAWSANGTINRNLFIGNTATYRANAAYLRDYRSVIGLNFYNNTIWDTSESTSIIRVNQPEHRVINNIIWRVSDQNLEDIDDISSGATIEYNIVKNGYDGTGNISDDPQFYEPDSGDFRLSTSSPAIDAGDPDLDNDGEDYSTDEDDQDPDGSRMDMGANILQPYLITDARELGVGAHVTVEGVVTSHNMATSTTSYSLQDETAGIHFYLQDTLLNFQLGDELRISGTLYDYNSLLEIIPDDASNISVLSQNNPLPDYQLLSMQQYLVDGESYESELIRFSDVVYVSGDWPEEGSSSGIVISDDEGATSLTMWLDSDTEIDGQSQPMDPFYVSGIGDQYNDSYTLRPQDYHDFSMTTDAGFENSYDYGNGWQRLPTFWEWWPEIG